MQFTELLAIIILGFTLFFAFIKIFDWAWKKSSAYKNQFKQ